MQSNKAPLLRGFFNSKSLFEKSFWVKLFALKPSFFFKTRFLLSFPIQQH